MRKLIIILLVLILVNSLYAQEAEYKEKTSIGKKILKNTSFEALGMRSIVLQKEPFSYQPITPQSGSNRTGYIPRPTYSLQIGIFKCIKLYKAIYLNTGIQLKRLYYKHELIAPTIYIPGINSPLFINWYNNNTTFTNYLLFKNGRHSIGIGIGLFEHNIKYRYHFYINRPLLLKYLLRYEIKIIKMKNSELHFLSEVESVNQKRDYFQAKIGLSIKKV